MNREELAWAGGLFEGEGYFSLSGKRSAGSGTSAIARIEMTDLESLERFQRAVGFGRILGPYNRQNRKPSYTWHAGTFPYVQAMVAMLWPWLGTRRRERAREVLLKDNVRNGKIGRPRQADETVSSHALYMRNRRQDEIIKGLH